LQERRKVRTKDGTRALQTDWAAALPQPCQPQAPSPNHIANSIHTKTGILSYTLYGVHLRLSQPSLKDRFCITIYEILPPFFAAGNNLVTLPLIVNEYILVVTQTIPDFKLTEAHE
jgi:hypothetical protein